MITALTTMGVAIFLSPIGRGWLNGLQVVWNAFIFWLVGLFS